MQMCVITSVHFQITAQAAASAETRPQNFYPGEYEVCFTETEFVGDYTINVRTEDNSDK